MSLQEISSVINNMVQKSRNSEFKDFYKKDPTVNMESDFAAESELLICEHGVICP